MTPVERLTTLHSFNDTDGNERCGVDRVTDGNFYGTHRQAAAELAAVALTFAARCLRSRQAALLPPCTSPSNEDCSDGFFPDAERVQGSERQPHGTTWTAVRQGSVEALVVARSSKPR